MMGRHNHNNHHYQSKKDRSVDVFDGNWFDMMAWMGPSQLVGSSQDTKEARKPERHGTEKQDRTGENLGRVYLLVALLKQMDGVPKNRWYDLPWLASYLGCIESRRSHPLFKVVLEVLAEALTELGHSVEVQDDKVVYLRQSS